MHYDPKYFRDPEKYRPERFLPGDAEFVSRPSSAFLPFGVGPRSCLGYRFALLQAMICLACLLPAVRVELDESRTDEVLELNEAITLGPKNGVWLKTMPR